MYLDMPLCEVSVFSIFAVSTLCKQIGVLVHVSTST